MKYAKDALKSKLFRQAIIRDDTAEAKTLCQAGVNFFRSSMGTFFIVIDGMLYRGKDCWLGNKKETLEDLAVTYKNGYIHQQLPGGIASWRI